MINLDINILKKNNISLPEALVALLSYYQVDIEDVISTMLNDNKILCSTDLGIRHITLTKEYKDKIEKVIFNKKEDVSKLDEFIKSIPDIAKALKEIYPKGKRGNLYWAESTSLIEKRLLTFYNKYKIMFTKEEIVNAVTSYVNSFNGNYTYMKVLKYFIFKEKKGVAGDIESESDLLNYLENPEATQNNNSWDEFML